MNRFEKQLDDLINKRNITNSKAAKLCKIDATLLRRYRKGERVPRDNKVLQKFYEGLNLSEKEKDDLAYAFMITKSPANILDVSMDELLTIIGEKVDGSDSSVWPVKEYICQDYDRDIYENQQMIELNQLEDIQNALAYVGHYAKINNDKIYILSQALREKDKFVPAVRFRMPDLQDTEQVIVINQRMDKYDLLTLYTYHSGICNQDREHSFYVYRTHGTIQISDSWLFFSDKFVLEFQIYSDSISGYLSVDSNIIEYHKEIYRRYRENSMEYENSIKDVFLQLIQKVR